MYLIKKEHVNETNSYPISCFEIADKEKTGKFIERNKIIKCEPQIPSKHLREVVELGNCVILLFVKINGKCEKELGGVTTNL
jgi:hypothetical protein